MADIGCCFSSRPGLRRIAAGAALLVVLCLALYMRLYRIGEETPHPDEITSLTGLYEKTFTKSLQAERTLDPPMTPLYFLVQYAWAHTVGMGVLPMRMLSVLFSVLTLLAVYRLGIRLNGKLAGLAAMALLAVSPIHVYYSLEIRNYSLTVLLSALSLLTLLRGVERPNGRTWALNFLVDLLLAMSHLFANLLFVPQALFLLIHHRRWRVLLPWTLSHAVISLAVGAWLATCDFQAIRSASSYFQPLNWNIVQEMLTSLAGAPYYQYIMVLGGKSIGGIFIAVFLLAVLVLLADRLFFSKRPADTGATDVNVNEPRALSLVALTFLVPPVLLGIITQCYTPCFIPRYVLCSVLAATLLLACAVTMPRVKTVGVLLAVGLAILNVYQWNDLLDRRPHRAGWVKMCAFLHDEVKPDDYLMVYPPYATCFISGIEILAPASPKRTIHKETWSAADLEELAAWHTQGIQVWVINHANEILNAELETSLTAHGMSFKKTVFTDPGLAVYRVPTGTPAQQFAGSPQGAPPSPPRPIPSQP